MHVLIIEDDARQAITLGEYLESHGHEPDFASDAALAVRLCGINRYDGIILDTRVTRTQPEELCLRLREQTRGATPVLKLTLAEPDQAVEGPGVEAANSVIDTLPASSSPDQIHDCLKTLVDGGSDGIAQLRVGALCMDLNGQGVHAGGVLVELSPISSQILELLMRAYPHIVTRATIEAEIWAGQRPTSNAALRGHIHRLRQLLDGVAEDMLIRTVHGEGYRLEPIRSEQGIQTK